MRPRERRETSEQDLFRSRLDQAFFQHALVFDRSSLTRWRQRMGQEKLKALLQESLAVASRTDAMKPSDLACVVIDTTVQPKAVMFPTDAKLLNRARERLVRLAKKLGVSLRQSYARVGKLALIKHQRYAHAHPFKRANRRLRKLKTYLGRIIRDIERRIVWNEDLREAFIRPCSWLGACWNRSAVSTATRSIPCTRQRSSASARAKHIGLTSSGSR
jgi:IS5 family transposase